MAYSSDEKETSCVYDYITKEWHVYTTVPSHLTKLGRIAEPYWKEEEPDKYGKPRIVAGKWTLSKSQVRFAKLIERKEDEPAAEEDEEDDVLEMIS